MSVAALGLALQIAVGPFATMPGVNAAPDDALTDSLRRMEGRFLVTWRKEWMLSQKPSSDYLRLSSLHCHNDGSWQGRAPNIIEAARSRRSYCPIWFSVDDSLPSDESDGVDVSLTDESRRVIRRARADLIARFSEAVERAPANAWIAGQLVRLTLDQRDMAAALRAARECRASKPWCLLLEGYARLNDGHVASADSIFVRAVDQMTREDRCEWTSVALLLDVRERAAYERIPCASRDTIDATFWWLADPLYMESGNERRAEHLARMITVRLHAGLTSDERWDWRPKYGGDALAAMVVRYGWPTFLYWGGWREDGGHFAWLEFVDNSVNVAPQYALPRFHTTPPWKAVLDPSTLVAADWARFAPRQGYGAVEWENDEWPTEHFARRGGPVLELNDQTVLFRRDHDALMAIGLDLPQRFFAPGVRVPYDAAIIGARDANERWTPARMSVAIDATTTTVLVTPLSAHPQVVSTELSPADGAYGVSARARRAVHPPAPLSVLQPGEVAISDPLFFRPSDDGTTPSTASDAISLMLGSLITPRKKVGIFWETYGVPPGDTITMTLRLASGDKPGILRRLGTSLGVVGAAGGEIAVNWREPRPGDTSGLTYAGDVPIQARSFVLDISRLNPGRYTLEISAGRPGAPVVSSRRAIEVRR